MNFLIGDLAEPSRRAILSELLEGERSVTQLVLATSLKQPNVSNHLAKLRARGILSAVKHGRTVRYSLANGQVATVIQAHLAHTAPPNSAALPLTEAASRYVDAAIAGNEEECAAIVQGLLAAAQPLLAIYEQVLSPAMQGVGARYTRKEIDEAQEHVASAITERMMAKIVQFFGKPQSIHAKAVLGCVAGNFHTIGLQMISDYLRLNGWTTVFLGANVPTAAFVNAVREHQPFLVLTSIAHEDNVPVATELLRELKAPRRVLGVGGHAAALHARTMIDVGADFVCLTLQQFSDEVLPTLRNHAAAD